ncbi:MAG: alkaline phosphatase family protein [Gemmataceae bacterium]
MTRKSMPPSRCLALILLLVPAVARADAPRRAENLVVVILDGFRWQEVFSGADDVLIHAKHGGVKDLLGLKKRYWRDDAEQRRDCLLPFFWNTVAREGQIFGDAFCNARAAVTNGLKFSYPGYSEMLCGFPDRRIASNDKRLNPNVNVLEFLQQQPAFKDRIGVFCTWDVFPYIFNVKRSGLKVSSGWFPLADTPLTERQRAVNDLIERLPRIWPDNGFDVTTMQAALEHLKRHKPRVMFIGLGETDEWGHARRYDLYLDAANKADRFLAELWTLLQKMPEYAGKTNLLITTDHGRGPTRENWPDHGPRIPNAEQIWIAAMGPDIPCLGVRRDIETTQSQVAATIARLLGEDYNLFCPKAARPLPLK